MAISFFQIFKIGIGPSSSHTVGPMKAAKQFMNNLKSKHLLSPEKISHIKTDLYGSLALTGQGHGTDKAVILGLMGDTPEKCDTQTVDSRLEKLRKSKKINLNGELETQFVEKEHLIFNKTKRLPFHTNGLKFTAVGHNNENLMHEIYYSVGGGFIVTEEETKQGGKKDAVEVKVPYPFATAAELLSICEKKRMRISEVMMENEKVWRSEKGVLDGINEIWEAMQECVRNGSKNEGFLPGPLKLERKASKLYKTLMTNPHAMSNPMFFMDWVNFFALAVCEENAAGGRVVTAPTNGAAGIIPAVLHYYDKFHKQQHPDKIAEFMLTSAAIGILYKLGATISGAEGGCQGEVGTACSMAAGGLVAALGGNMAQVANGAEIGMEHNLGLTCDPVGGLVQIPCIERNTMGTIKAINAATLALNQPGGGKVSLDSVIKVMKKTGDDMKSKYKETAKGGLATEIGRILQLEKKKEGKKGKKDEFIISVGDTVC
jgi:L-serine dehydratase